MKSRFIDKISDEIVKANLVRFFYPPIYKVIIFSQHFEAILEDSFVNFFKNIYAKMIQLNSLFIVIVCSLVLALSEAKPGKTWNCDAEDVKTVDKLVNRIMTYGQTDRRFPINKAELKSYCK